ncbi:type II secretion system F family protein [Lentzea aerocolonigenes]|uniref:type II secretion system F family protein n=1 Tax=Lentzea aerocolonigenes TaxID=68170 RepID=UPI0004C3F30C|nr:type II secretion system F family protein [Lentzea aerocolonigenes]MCP2243580.1 tight adherence protein C [Lentzea aerocolonigenes]
MSGTFLLLTGVAAVAGALALAGAQVATAATGTARVSRGLAQIETTYGQGATDVADTDGEALPSALDRLRALAARISPATAIASLEHRLDLAGNPSRWTAERVMAFKGVGLLGLAPIGALYGLGSALTLVAYALAGAAVGFFLPDVLVHNAATKRQALMGKELADVLDMLTVCVEAGLGFDAAVSQVARNTSGPLSVEFSRLLQEMQLGKSRVEALRSLSGRTTVAAVHTFASSLVQASELGIPTARVLHEQAGEIRVKRRQAAEEKAQKVPVKILFPLLLCIFPALFIIIIGPAGIEIYDSLIAG